MKKHENKLNQNKEKKENSKKTEEKRKKRLIDEVNKRENVNIINWRQTSPRGGETMNITEHEASAKKTFD